MNVHIYLIPIVLSKLFESNDLMAISQRLDSLRQSLDLLSHVNDYSDRLLQLDGLRNRLEALASPYLVSAISVGDIAKTANMVQVSSVALFDFFTNTCWLFD